MESPLFCLLCGISENKLASSLFLEQDYQVALSLQQEQLTEPSQNCVTATNSTSDSE